MRTTVELKSEYGSRLLAIAAKQRGEKGFSSVLNEAVESYISVKKRNANDDGRRPCNCEGY